jgi:hypothetical protein
MYWYCESVPHFYRLWPGKFRVERPVTHLVISKLNLK